MDRGHYFNGDCSQRRRFWINWQKLKFMTRLIILLLTIGAMASCRSTKKIQTAITKKDTAVKVTFPTEVKKNDSSLRIMSIVQSLKLNEINYQTFTAKVNVD